MPISTSGTVTFEQNGRYAKMHIPHAVSLSALKTFAEAFAAWTDAAIVAVSFSQEEEITTIPSSGVQVLDMMAMTTLHGEVGKTKSKNLAVPAVKQNMFENVQYEGLKVTEAKGNALATAYTALVGETFTFVKGRLFGVNPTT
jgi:hypothetical protein